MNASFAPLLTLNVEHGYFPSGNSEGLAFIPTTSAQRVMNRLGIRVRPNVQNLQLYYREKSPASDHSIQDEQGPIQLSFIVRAKDHLFLNYTEAPLDNTLPFFYFNNLDGASAFTFPGEAGAEIRPSSFDINGDFAGKTISLLNELDKEVESFEANGHSFSESIIHSLDQEGNTYRIIQDNIPYAGPHRVMADGEEIAEFMCLPPNFQQGDLALITFYIGDTSAHGTYILAGGAITPATYNLSFQPRKTIWDYYIINNSQLTVNHYAIVDSATNKELGASASPPETQIIAGGGEAVVISLNEAKPLLKRPDTVLELVANTEQGGRNQDIRINLPSPSAQQLKAPTDNGSPHYHSPVYVYL